MNTNTALADPPPAAAPSKPREYKLAPVTVPMPGAAERLLRKHQKLRDKASALFAEASAVMAELTSLKIGAKKLPAVVPGTVYKLSAPLLTNKGAKLTVQIVDEFQQPEVMKMCVFNRFAVKMWKGDGPMEDRPARAAGKAAADILTTPEDQLP